MQSTNKLCTESTATAMWHGIWSLLSFRSHNLLFGFVLVFINLGNKDWEWLLNSHHVISHQLTHSKLCFASRQMMNNMFIVSYSYLCMQLVSLGFRRYFQLSSVPHLHRWEGSRTEGPLPGDIWRSNAITAFHKTCISHYKPKRRQFFLVLNND